MRTSRLIRNCWPSSPRRARTARPSLLVRRARSDPECTSGSPAQAGAQISSADWTPAFAGEQADRSLADLQNWMLDSIVSGTSREAVHARIVGDARLGAEGRFAIYAGGYRSRLIETLRDD